MKKMARAVLLAPLALVVAMSWASRASADIIADSVQDFSGTQGLNGWTYGYWDESGDADGKYDQRRDLRIFGNFGTDPINRLAGHAEFTTGNLWYLEDGRYYTSLWAEGGHPHGDMYLGKYARANHWTVRRWVSTVSGRIEIRGHAGKVMPWGKNWSGSVKFLVVVDGNRVYEAEADEGGSEYSASASVEVGTPVDFLIGPGSAIGVSRFTAILEKPTEYAPTPERESENNVLAANHRYDLALVAADTSTLNSLSLPEFTYIGPGGTVRNKEEQIREISSGNVDIIEGSSDDVQARIHGDTAIVVGQFKGRARVSGNEFSFHERYSTVWIRQGIDWRLALEHGTVVKDK